MHLAIDLGASSGRLVVGAFRDAGLIVKEVHRFTHPLAEVDGHLRWDIHHILGEIRTGIRLACDAARDCGDTLASIGADSWGVDYGLIDRDGALVDRPISYRDSRTRGRMDEVFREVSRREIFERTGIQFMELNTLYQLVAHCRGEEFPPSAHRMVLIGDLVHVLLGGLVCSEYTNATTTQMIDARTGGWDLDLLQRLRLPVEILPPIVQPGTRLGVLRTGSGQLAGVAPVPLVAPATHDTACAVVATPLEPGWAYLSSGTWSLLGVERTRPLISDAAYTHNFTNEGGACGTIRFLKNVAGLWILESCRRQWAATGTVLPYGDLTSAMAACDGPRAFIDPDSEQFFNPPDMVAAIQQSLRETSQPAPDDEVGLSRVILDSLARRYAEVVNQLETVTGQPIKGIHIVGGGCQNAYLNQATADACRRPVRAGPVEATSLGNLMIQALAAGRFRSLDEARRYVAAHVSVRRYEPRDPDGHRWE